ncbi:MAG: hypothetical protein QM796_03660 [Chthoniobacteraceae bacterium]
MSRSCSARICSGGWLISVHARNSASCCGCFSQGGAAIARFTSSGSFELLREVDRGRLGLVGIGQL